MPTETALADEVGSQMIDTLDSTLDSGLGVMTFPLSGAATERIGQSIMFSMNENERNDCNWKEQIVDKVLDLDISLNKVKEAIKQGDEEVRAKTKNLLNIEGDAAINPTQNRPEGYPANVETRPDTIP